MDQESRHLKISIGLNILLGVLMGWVSTMLGRGLYAIAAALLVAYVASRITMMIVGKKGVGWLFGNAVVIFLFAWFDVWVLLINM